MTLTYQAIDNNASGTTFQERRIQRHWQILSALLWAKIHPFPSHFIPHLPPLFSLSLFFSYAAAPKIQLGSQGERCRYLAPRWGAGRCLLPSRQNIFGIL